MGVTVPYGLPYPEPTDPTKVEAAIEALARAVDTTITSMLGSAMAAARPKSALIAGPPQPLAAGVVTNLTFNQVLFDNAGYANLAADPTALFLEPNMLHVVFASLFVETNTAGFVNMTFSDSTGTGIRARQVRANLQPFEGTTAIGSIFTQTGANGLRRVRMTQSGGAASENTSAVLFGAIKLG